MGGQWFLERHGNLLGPYSLEQVRGLVSSGQLRATDRVMRQGSSQLLPVHDVAEIVDPDSVETTVVAGMPIQEPLPALSVSQAPRLAPAPWNKKRLSLGIGVIAVVLALVVYLKWPSDSDDEPDFSSPDLPEWFHRAHRIRAAQGKKVGVFPGLGILNPPKNPPPPPRTFNASWFEKNFTHYLEREAYIYSVPERKYYSDGRMHVGTKVLVGEIASADVALVCVCSQTGRP